MVTVVGLFVASLMAFLVLPLVVVGWLMLGLVVMTGLVIFVAISAVHHALLLFWNTLRRRK